MIPPVLATRYGTKKVKITSEGSFVVYPSGELTYPTLVKGTSSSTVLWEGIS